MDDPGLPWWFRALFRYGAPVFRLAPSTVGREENGERTLFCASRRFPARGGTGKGNGVEIGIAESSDGVHGGGAYRVNWNGEPVALGKQYPKMREDGWAEKMVQHTFKAWEDIEMKGKFTD